MDRDEADRALALERAEPLLHPRGRQAEAALARELDRDQVAVLRASAVAPGGMSSSRPSCFLSTGTSRPPPFGSARKMPSWRCLRAVEHLDDAAGVADRFAFLAALLGAQQRAVADAGDFAGRALRGTWMRMRGASPCASVSHSVGTAISSPSASRCGDVGEHDRGQGAGVVQLLAPLLDRALVGEVAQHRAAAPRGRRSSGRRRARSRARRPCPCACR